MDAGKLTFLLCFVQLASKSYKYRFCADYRAVVMQ